MCLGCQFPTKFPNLRILLGHTAQQLPIVIKVCHLVLLAFLVFASHSIPIRLEAEIN